MKAYIKRLVCAVCAVLLLLSLCACSLDNEPDISDELPPQEDTTPTPTETPAEPIEESYTITASDDDLLGNSTTACSLINGAKDMIRNYGIEYTFTHVLSTGEVETEVKTVVLRTERYCTHVWSEAEGHVLEGYEDGEVYAQSEYEAECQIEEGRVDTMVDYAYDRVYYYTDSEGQQQTVTQTIQTETVRTCDHLPEVTDAE